MAYTVTQFREETVVAFERDYSILRVGCLQEHMRSGNEAKFLVAGSGSNQATTRGNNGQIMYQSPDRNQHTVTLKPSYGTSELGDFDIFQSQGDQAAIMQKDAIDQLNREIDDTIIAELGNFTLTTGAAATASVAMVLRARAILSQNNVKVNEVDNMFAAVTPAFMAYLMQLKEFASSEYVSVKPYEGPARTMCRWLGINWMEHTGLDGMGTASETCFMWHKNAIGHAANLSDKDVDADVDRKNASSWCLAKLFHGAKKLQNGGGIKMIHDGSAFAA